ncbi:hypothetical protein [Leisingera sp. D0M16]
MKNGRENRFSWPETAPVSGSGKTKRLPEGGLSVDQSGDLITR